LDEFEGSAGDGEGEGVGDGEGEGVGDGEGEGVGEGEGEGVGEGELTMVELQLELTAAAGTLACMATAALKAGTVAASRQISALETTAATPPAEIFDKAIIGVGVGVVTVQLTVVLVVLVQLPEVCILRSAM